MRADLPIEVTLEVRDRCLCLHLQRAARAVGRRFDEALRPFNLTHGQYSLLVSLNRPHPPRISDVATLLAMDRTTLTANLKPLARRGLLAITPDPKDKRGRLLNLTDAGRDLLVQEPGLIAEPPGERIVGHDAEADLVCDEEERIGTFGDETGQRAAGRADIHVAENEIGGPQRQAINQNHWAFGTNKTFEAGDQIKRRLMGLPPVAARRLVVGDACLHFRIKRLGRCDIMEIAVKGPRQFFALGRFARSRAADNEAGFPTHRLHPQSPALTAD